MRKEALAAALTIMVSIDPSSLQAQLPISPDALAEGAGQFLLDRAEGELRAFAAEHFRQRLCREIGPFSEIIENQGQANQRVTFEYTGWQVTARDLMSNTCQQLADDEGDVAASFALGSFRSALRDDLVGLGKAIVRRVVTRFRERTRVAALLLAMPNNTEDEHKARAALAAMLSNLPSEFDTSNGFERRAWVALATLDLLQAATAAIVRRQDAAAALQWDDLEPELTYEGGTLCVAEVRPFWSAVVTALRGTVPTCAGGAAPADQAATERARIASRAWRLSFAPSADFIRAQDDAIAQELDLRLTAALRSENVIDGNGTLTAGVTQTALDSRRSTLAPTLSGQIRDQLAAAVNASRSDLTRTAAESAQVLLRLANTPAAERNGDHSKATVEAAVRLTADIATAAICAAPADAERCGFAREAFSTLEEVVVAIAERRFVDALQKIATSRLPRDLLTRALAGPNSQDANDDSREERTKWIERALRLLQLAADMSNADSASGVQSMLDSFADPLGGWRGKHEGGLTLSLQGFAGVYVGAERIELDGSPQWRTTFGPSLSFGLEIARAGSRGRDTRMVGYLQLIDVANVLSVRVNGDGGNVAAVEDPTWAQLFAPGVFLGPSLGRSPFDALFGCAYVPALRRDVDSPVAALRCTAGLSVDVTIMRLH